MNAPEKLVRITNDLLSCPDLKNFDPEIANRLFSLAKEMQADLPQPARSGQGVEPVAWECSGEPGLYSNITRSKGEADHHRKIGRTVRPLVYGDTKPQAAQQGSVTEIIKAIADKLEKVDGESADGGCMWDARECAEFIREEADKLSTPTTPQADGWISMKDQFPNTFTPKLGWNKTANVRHQANTYRIFSPMAENVCDISHWMELPQPPKEGE